MNETDRGVKCKRTARGNRIIWDVPVLPVFLAGFVTGSYLSEVEFVLEQTEHGACFAEMSPKCLDVCSSWVSVFLMGFVFLKRPTTSIGLGHASEYSS